jgi:PAS domain S-box-containing protein
VTIRLRQFPLPLYEVIRERNDALLRDYALFRLEHGELDGPSAEEISLGDDARQELRSAVDNALGVLPGGLDVPSFLDLELTIDRERVPAFAALRALLDAGDALAEGGRLLTAATLPELRAVQDWYFDQVAEQAQGRPPTSWTPPLPVDAPVVATRLPDEVPDADSSTRAVVFADNSNRIIAASPAAERLLGWPIGELIGHRILVVIPPAARELHIIGFTRFLATGRSAILGQALTLDAWHHEGRPIPVTLTVRQQHAAGMTYYAADLVARVPDPEG